MFGLTYILDKVFIQVFGLAYEVYVKVSPLLHYKQIFCGK